MKEKIQQLAKDFFQEVVNIRRTIHANPELAYEEFETATLIARELDQLQIPYQKNIAGTGIVAILQCQNPYKKCVALRADMDALPIEEANEVAYKSQHKGKMHACGHDVHTANLLGVIKILHALQHEIEGTYKFIFQPSEEKMPSGATAMIAAGALQNPTPDCILALHVSPEIEVGNIGFRSGAFMASADEIYITVRGKGGHAARPQEIINPLFTAAKILSAFENITDLSKPLILSFGKIEGKGATNIVPDTVSIEGTLRCFDETIRNETQQWVQATAQQIAIDNHCTIEVNIIKGYPVLINNELITAQVKKYTAEYIGLDHVLNLPIRMGAEDFAFYTHHIPACFYRIGVGNAAKGITSGIHTSTFNIDEQALEISIGNMAWVSVNV